MSIANLLPTLQAIAKALGGDIGTDRALVHCVRLRPPSHTKADRAGALWTRPQYPGCLYARTYSARDDRLAVKYWVFDQLGIARGDRRIKSNPRSAPPAPAAPDTYRKLAAATWAESGSILAAVPQAYFASRAITLTDEIV